MKVKMLAICFYLILFVENFVWSRLLPQNPNIWIIATNFRSNKDIPSETEILSIPNLKKLLLRGIFFKNPITTGLICMTASSAIITSKYPHLPGIRRMSENESPVTVPIHWKKLVTLGNHILLIGNMHLIPFEQKSIVDEGIVEDGKHIFECNSHFAGDYLNISNISKTGLIRLDFVGSRVSLTGGL